MGIEGHERAKRWLEHVEKTYRVMQSQGNLPTERWVEITTWFLGRELASWWNQETWMVTGGKRKLGEFQTVVL